MKLSVLLILIAGGLFLLSIIILGYVLHLLKKNNKWNKRTHNEELFYQAMMKHAVDSIYLKDRDHHVIMTNEFFYRNLNKTPDEIFGLTDYELFGDEMGKTTTAEEDRIMQTGEPLISAVEESGYETGERHYSLTTKVPIYDAGKVIGIFGITREFTAIAKLQKELTYSATHDSLTGLSNRSAIAYTLHEMLQREEALAVLFIDMDDFKHFNDEYGHDFGDELLKLVGRRMEHSFRKEDLIGRLSGDEFVVVLRSIHTKEEVEIATKKLIESFRHPFITLGETVILNFSIGIACTVACPMTENVSVEDLIRCADRAMYQVKRRGKGGYQFYEGICGT